MGFRVGTTRTPVPTAHVRQRGQRCARCRSRRRGLGGLDARDRAGGAHRGDDALAALWAPDAAVHRSPGQRCNGLVGDQALIDEVFARVDTDTGGMRCCATTGSSSDDPHHVAQTYEGRRRNVTVTLCGDRRGRTPMHTVAVGGRDPEVGARRSSGAGLSVRPAKAGWRAGATSRASRTTATAIELVDRIAPRHPVHVRQVARLGAPRDRPSGEQPAVHPGVGGPPGHGHVHRRRRATTSSSPSSGGARPAGVRPRRRGHAQLRRQRPGHPQLRSTASAARTSRTSSTSTTTTPTPQVVRLEQNYRSTQTILSAANAVVANNRGRKGRRCGPSSARATRSRSASCADEHAEARFVAAEIERLVDEGVSRDEIAVFYRMNAQSRVLEDMLVRARIGYQVIGGTKFYERAEVKDAIGYLTFLVNPADGGAFTRDRQLAASAASGRPRCRACSRTPTRWASRRGRRPRRRRRCPTLGTPARKAFGRFMSTMERLRERVGGGAPVGDAARGAAARRRATSTRWRPSGRSRRRAGSRTSRSWCASRASTTSRGRRRDRRRAGVPAADRAARRRRPAARRRGPRDADDAAQRQGARVPDRVHHRLRGRRVPALARARRGRRSRRSGGWPTSASRAPCATSTSPTRAGATSFGARRLRPALALPRRDPARADRPAGPQRASAPAARRAPAASRRGRRAAAASAEARRRRPTAPGRCSASATTSSTPPSARAS